MSTPLPEVPPVESDSDMEESDSDSEEYSWEECVEEDFVDVPLHQYVNSGSPPPSIINAKLKQERSEVGGEGYNPTYFVADESRKIPSQVPAVGPVPLFLLIDKDQEAGTNSCFYIPVHVMPYHVEFIVFQTMLHSHDRYWEDKGEYKYPLESLKQFAIKPELNPLFISTLPREYRAKTASNWQFIPDPSKYTIVAAAAYDTE
jgi:hypothetical protein